MFRLEFLYGIFEANWAIMARIDTIPALSYPNEAYRRCSVSGISYKDAGVDTENATKLLDRIRPLAASTYRPSVIAGLGGFAGLFEIPAGYRRPVLVAGTDGVGTKLRLAFESNRHDTVGIDLVAMCVNDILCYGAKPLVFLDYFATGRLDPAQAEAVLRGIVKGCEIADCSLIGGETAEMPGFYPMGEYDLAGFAVGVVEREDIVDGARVQAGDVVVGVRSAGLHSSGFSLARRVLLDPGAERGVYSSDDERSALIASLLEPTRIYARAVPAAMSAGDVRSIAHITGGGIPGNLPRVLPKQVDAQIDVTAWHVPAIFRRLQEFGPISTDEMRRTFNLGIGLTLIVPRTDADAVVTAVTAAGERATVIGEIVSGSGQVFFSGAGA